MSACVGGFCSIIYALVMLALAIFSIWCMWKIAERAGYDPILSLLMLIPLFNIYVLYVFAFQEWPVEKKWREGGGGAAPEPPPPEGP